MLPAHAGENGEGSSAWGQTLPVPEALITPGPICLLCQQQEVLCAPVTESPNTPSARVWTLLVPRVWTGSPQITILNLSCRDAGYVPQFVLPLALLDARITAQRHQKNPSPTQDPGTRMLSSALALPSAAVPQAPAWDQHPHQWGMIPSLGRKSWLNHGTGYHQGRCKCQVCQVHRITQTQTCGCKDTYVCWRAWTQGHSLS